MSSAGDLRNPTSSRRSRRAHKGKAKEQETAPDAKQGTTEGTIADPTLALNTLTESDDEWAWNTLANSAVNHRPAALTADGKYVSLRSSVEWSRLPYTAYLQLLLLDHWYHSEDLLRCNGKSRVYIIFFVDWKFWHACR